MSSLSDQIDYPPVSSELITNPLIPEMNDPTAKRKNSFSQIKSYVEIEEAAKSWPQCCFYMTKKQRFCNIERSRGSQFCGNHRPPEEKVSERITKRFRLEGGAEPPQRCPCPIDPSHTIYVHNLKSHVLVCNSTTRALQMESEPFYKKDCNSGPLIDDSTRPSDTASEVDCELLVQKITQVYKSLTTESLSESSESEINETIESDADCVEDLVQEAMKAYLSSKNLQRHVQQNVHLARRMVASGLLNRASSTADQTAYVELGAGKGMLGLAVSAVLPQSAVVMVERSGARQKTDKLVSAQGQCFRARMDIRHTYLRGLPGVAPGVASSSANEEKVHGVSSERSVVVIAKHLCGVATDLAIRSLLVYRNESNEKILDSKAKGLAIATCCHHVSIFYRHFFPSNNKFKLDVGV